MKNGFKTAVLLGFLGALFMTIGLASAARPAW